MELMNARETYEFWLSSPYFNEAAKEELYTIINDEKEIEDRFYRDLEFGTGGLRGVLGMGTNRMNIYTVRKATQGLANYIIKLQAQAKGVAIAFDSRRMSPEFADEAACCLAANNICVYIFSSLRPTPILSFALRQLGCIAGIVITASHNPAEYNGYKVYWEDGAQITTPRDYEIIREVNAITDYAQVKTIKKTAAKAAGLYREISSEMDDRYIAELKKLVLNPESIAVEASSLKIVYTPLHGTGNFLVQRILKEFGFENVYIVAEQEKPDGNFPTVLYPNPEDENTFSLALKLAKEVDADLVLATDPDADRLGLYAKDSGTGEYMKFNGNMLGALLMDYELSQRQMMGKLPENSAVVTTIVSGKMSQKIAKKYHVNLIETLTGFKYIGEQIKLFEQNHSYTYLFGYEESYGCLIGTHARDKDAIAAVIAVCEAAAYYRQQGITLCDQMMKLFTTYGYYKEGLYTVTLKGKDGAKHIANMMEQIRARVPETIGDFHVIEFRDYYKGIQIKCDTNEKNSIVLPKSNVIYFSLEEEAWCCVRPSGTEPKIKFYIGVCGKDNMEASQKYKILIDAVCETFLIKRIERLE